MTLTEDQKAQIEAKRLQALEKLRQRQQARQSEAQVVLDQRGGFTRDEDQEEEEPLTSLAKPTRPAPAIGQAETSAPISGAGVCEACGLTSVIDQIYERVFDVVVCVACKTNNEEEYGLVSKGDAVAEYLVQEGTMRVLPYIERSNPRHAKFQSMKLYLRKQVKAKSYERWGGAEGLEVEHEKRRKRKYEASLVRVGFKKGRRE